MAEGGETMGYTHRGTQWEYRQSLYVLLLLTPWFYWVPLVYTGFRVLQLRWIIFGLFYGLPAFLKMAVDPADFGMEGFVKRWLFAFVVIAGIHTFRARGEFLVRLANAIELKELLMEGARMRREAAASQEAEEDSESTSRETAATEPAATPSPSRRLFDINTIGERELLLMPGMGPERVRQTLALRELHGGFHSFDHFAEKLQLKDDVRERLRPLFIQPPPAHETHPDYSLALDGRRVLEINLASASAIASLPGLNETIGRRAVMLREADGPFKSVEDFRYRLGLTSDDLIASWPIISTVKTPAHPSGTPGARGRMVDASANDRREAGTGAKPAGRIVDL
jgi:DNA uptake protein ComE-like DNA-binding protein